MRVIGGEFRSRLLKSLPGLDIRPTPDRLRETLFDILAPRIQGVRFADIYAGTGAIGIEAVSRGAHHATFVEQSAAAVRLIRENLHSLGIQSRAHVRHGRAATVAAQIEADLFFLDPPYRLEKEYERVLAMLEGRAKLAIAQHSSRLKLPDAFGTLVRTRIVEQGDNALSFYEPQ
jgi:16S rRNA (guanine966-N2)-methyltransferase